MRGLYRWIYAWLPAIAWMGLIFFMSSRQRISVADEYLLNFLFFKTLHVAEYAILYFLVFRAFYIFPDRHSQTKSTFLSAITIAIFYAITDEVHQTLVPTREGTVRDVLIDTLGIVIMYTLIRKYFRVIKKYLEYA